MGTEDGSGGSVSEQIILATAGYDHTVRFWQVQTGICRRQVQNSDAVNVLEITPDRQLIATAGYQTIRMFELNTVNPNPVFNYEGVQKNVTALGFQEDYKWMFTGGEDGLVRVWDIRLRNLQCQRGLQANASVNSVCLHSNQAELLFGDQNGAIHLWDLRANKQDVMVLDSDVSVQHVCFTSDSKLAAAITNKGKCYVWNVCQGQGDEVTQLNLRNEFQAHNRYGLKCKFSPDSRYLATTSADTTAKIWNVDDMSLVTVLQTKNQRWVWDIAFSNNSMYVITASSDHVARLWNVEKGEVVKEYSGHQKAVTALAFRDGVKSS